MWFATSTVVLGAACEDKASGVPETSAETATAPDSAVDSEGDATDDTALPPDSDVTTEPEVMPEVETIHEVDPGETGETVTPPPITPMG